MAGRIDVHSHILPGIDDGCADLEQSLTCARALLGAGYSHVFCTPHFWWNLPHVTPANIVRWTEDLQAHLDSEDIELKLMPGGELNLRPEIMALTKEQIPTYGMLGRYCIFDIWTNVIPTFFEPAVRHLQGLGLKVILAHPERMQALQSNSGLIDRMQEMGLLLQGNFQCLSDPEGMMTRVLVERWLREGRYFLMGTDTHNPGSLPCRLEGLRRAIELVGSEVMGKLTVENPKELMRG